MNTVIKYTIEYKNDTYLYSDFFLINKKTDIIRFRTLGENSDIEKNIKKIYINGKDIDFKSICAANTAFKLTVICIIVNEFLNSTNDIKIELIENSKIEVFLFTEDKY
jgi:hypothetical protein